MRRTRGDHAIVWIEKFCRHPDPPHKQARLSHAECWQVRQIYDHPDGPQSIPVTGPLAGWLALLHVVGPEALQRDFRPAAEVDAWTLWRSTSPELQAFLRREGEAVTCPQLNTRWPVAA